MDETAVKKVESEFITDDDVGKEKMKRIERLCGIKEEPKIEEDREDVSVKEETMVEVDHHKAMNEGIVVEVDPEFITDDDIGKNETNLKEGESDERCSIKEETGGDIEERRCIKEETIVEGPLNEENITRSWQSVQQCSESQQSISCDQCGKCFISLKKLKVHQRIHLGMRPHVCSDCGKSYTRAAHLEVHRRSHTGEKPHTCDECGKSFTEASTLRRHRRIHAGVKPYTCYECGKSFTRGDHLKFHQNSHTGEKPYICEECGKSFTDPGNLKRHRRGRCKGVKPYYLHLS